MHPPDRQRVRVPLGKRSYDIDIGHGLLRLADTFAQSLPAGVSSVAIVTNDRVGPLYAERVRASLAPHVARIVAVQVPDGEAHKTLETFESILSQCLEARLDRRSAVVALGGGVIGDLAGFAAACFQRGIAVVQVPTTLLAQVDSSVGGKTGVNHPAGKNLVGAFHQPSHVVIDIETLDSLPAREIAAGIAEIVKIAAVADAGFFERVARDVAPLAERDAEALTAAIARSCALKAGLVGEDEREEGRRAILNFGHTFGHAIETAAGYGNWLHGEAVACGMAMAADLSCRVGSLTRSDAERLLRAIRAAGLPLEPPKLSVDAWLDLMKGDKKSVAGEIRFVLLDGIGSARVAPVPAALLRATLIAFGATPD